MDEAQDHGWKFGDESVTTSPSAAVFSMWYENRQSGIWPRAGGWLDQPLSLLVQMKAIDIVIEATRAMQSKEFDWTHLSKLQADLVRWLNG